MKWIVELIEDGKVKSDFMKVNISGVVTLIDGKLPDPPEGFKYASEMERGKGATFYKAWDHFGKVITEINFIPEPERYKNVSVAYEVCEVCGQKLMLVLENLRKKYQYCLMISHIDDFRLINFYIMGTYDNIEYSCKCPVCEHEIDKFQSKDADCMLHTLKHTEVSNFYVSCKVCETWIEFDKQQNGES